jgi:hypothetical protein
MNALLMLFASLAYDRLRGVLLTVYQARDRREASLLPRGFLLTLLFNSEDGGNFFIRNAR